MKTLHNPIIIGVISSMIIVGVIFVIFQTIIPGPLMQSKTTGNVEIQNIQVQPSIVRIGDTFTVNATLVNNSQNSIYVDLSPCNGPFVIIDSHVTVDVKVDACEDVLIEKKVNHGEKITRVGLDPTTAAFRATTAGTANATITFYYSEKDPLGGSVKSNSQKTISKSFLFTISPEKTISQYALNDTQTAIAVNLAKNSTQFQSLVNGYSYKFDGAFGYLHTTSQNDFEVITYVVDFSRYKGPIIPFEAERLITVYENPTLTQVFNITSENRGFVGGPGGPNLPLDIEKFCSNSSACYLRLFYTPQELVPLCDNSPDCYVVGSNGYAMHVGDQSVLPPINQGGTTVGTKENDGILSGDVSAYVYGGPFPGVSPNRSVHYEVDVYATDGVTIVGKTLSDYNAHYSIQLSAGNYIIYTYNDTKQTHLVSVSTGKNTVFNISSSMVVP